MRFIYSTSVIIVLTAFFFLLQYSRALSILGINPNFMLVFPLFLIFKEEKPFPFFITILFSAALAFFFSSFWVFNAFVALLITVVVFFARAFFTGNRMIDFFLMIVATTLLFLLILFAFHWEDISFYTIAGSILYNVIIGALIALAGSRIHFYER